MNKNLIRHITQSSKLGIISVSLFFVGIVYLSDPHQICAYFPPIVDSVPSPSLCSNGNVQIPSSWPSNSSPSVSSPSQSSPSSPSQSSPSSHSQPSGGGGDNCTAVGCSSGSSESYCPEGTTMMPNTTCCPNQYIVAVPSSGKGSGNQACNPPPPPPPPTATISQSKVTTETGESFIVTYGRDGGGSATLCVLERTRSSVAYDKNPNFLVVGIMNLLSLVTKNTADTALAAGGGLSSANQVVSNSGGISTFTDNLSATGRYTYRAQCSGPGGTSSWVSLEHIVIDPKPTVTLTADQYIIPYNTSTILRWNSLNSTSCDASGAWGGPKALSGSESSGNLMDPATYFIQCHDDRNQSSDPAVVTINILYGEGANIEVNPGVTRKGNPVNVTWDTGTSDPANCQIQTGAVILQSPLTSNTGSLTHVITGETTFTLNCENGRNTDEATVKVPPEFQET